MATGSDLVLNAQRRWGDTTTFHFGVTSHWLPWINEGQQLMTRAARSHVTSFLMTTVSAQAAYSVTAAQNIWEIRQVYWDNEPLEDTDILSLQKTYDPTWKSHTSGTPRMWYQERPDQVCLYPSPDSATTTKFRVDAYYTPADMTTATTCVLPPLYQPGLVYYALWQAADEDRDGDPTGLTAKRFWSRYEQFKKMYVDDVRGYSPKLDVLGGYRTRRVQYGPRFSWE